MPMLKSSESGMTDMNTSSAGNEAEFQVAFIARIRAALPLLPANIKVERYLHLHLGRRAFEVDGGATVGPGVIHGRYDGLVLLDDVPLLLAELKAPEESVSENDVAQAFSYARVHRPMVPLVLVSNGKKHFLRTTYDEKDLDPALTGVDELKGSLSTASELAVGAVQDAIRVLLGASNKVWNALASAWTTETINALTGDIRDFANPIPDRFIIPREAVKKVEDHLAAGAKIVVLHGPPMAGVTNALVQFAQASKHETTLLVEARSVPDVLQLIANCLTRELAFPVSKDDLRGWLNARQGLLELRLVIDGLPGEGVEELVEFANAGLIRLVLGINSAEFQKASSVAGRREKTLLGRVAIGVELQPLSDEEFFEACDVLFTSFGAGFYRGAEHVPDLRHPRRLRSLVSTLPLAPPRKDSTRETIHMLAPIPGPQAMHRLSREIVSEPKLQFVLQRLAAVFLSDAEQHVGDPEWLAATWGRPSVDPNRLEAELGRERVEWLCDLGFLSWVDTQGLGPRLLVRLEELLADTVANIWAARLNNCMGDAALKTEVERLLRLTFVVPSGEVALALAIGLSAMQSENNILGVIVPFLFGKKPSVSEISEASRAYLLVKDARIDIEFGEDTAETAIGGLEAWVVLSHLASWNIGEEGGGTTANAGIIAELGAAPYLISFPRPIGPRLAPGYHFHDFKGVGSVLCLSTGIVEPLVQSMLSHASQFPGEFVRLAKHAIKEKTFHLAWRLLTVATVTSSMADERVAAAASAVEEVLGKWWRQFLDDFVKHHAPDANALPAQALASGAPEATTKDQLAYSEVGIEDVSSEDLSTGENITRCGDIAMEAKDAVGDESVSVAFPAICRLNAVSDNSKLRPVD